MVFIGESATTGGITGAITHLVLISNWLSDHVGPRGKGLYSCSGQGWLAEWSPGENRIRVLFDDNMVTAETVVWFRLIWC